MSAQYYDVYEAPVVDAVQWDGTSAVLEEIQSWTTVRVGDPSIFLGVPEIECKLTMWVVKNSEGGVEVVDYADFPGSYILKA